MKDLGSWRRNISNDRQDKLRGGLPKKRSIKAGADSKGTRNENRGRKEKDVGRRSDVLDLGAAVHQRYTYFRFCFSM